MLNRSHVYWTLLLYWSGTYTFLCISGRVRSLHNCKNKSVEPINKAWVNLKSSVEWVNMKWEGQLVKERLQK
jgi:hypothetical protein